MTIEQILADNLDALMSMHPEYNSQHRLSKKSGIGQTTVGRIRRADGAATIDNVYKIAKAFHLTASQLLDPRLREQLGILKNPGSMEKAAALAAQIQESDLNDKQLTILSNTLDAMRS